MKNKLLSLLLILSLGFSSIAANAMPLANQAKPTQNVKKDGTPDKRFKENKAPKAPLKKDGTPDKRFKENKAPKGPLKKDGTPDMRSKANNPNAGKKKTK
jgi:hypothetical protein